MRADPQSGSAALHPVTGRWSNERGSTLTLVVNGNVLGGHYATAVGNPDPKDAFAVHGIVAGHLLSFAVAWQGHDSLTAWTGRYEPDTDSIHTLWHLVRSHVTANDATGAKVRNAVDLWSAFTTQASVFRRT